MSIDEEAGISAEQMADKLETEAVQAEALPASGGFGFRLPEWFYIERSQEPIESFREHPLNFGKSEGMSYIIRGFSALAGGVLNYWWMDVVGGFLRLRKESAAKVIQEAREIA